MSGHVKKLSDLGIVIPNQLGIHRVLQSLPPSYKNFVMNYNMQNMNKELPELFSMLKSAEGSKKAAAPPKPKAGPKPDTVCYYCKEEGHGSIMAAPSINFNQFLEKEKLKSNGSNFTDWFRHVRIFLTGGNLQYVLDAPLGAQPAETAPNEVKNVYQTRKTQYSQVQCAILCSLEAELQKRFEHHDPYELVRELKAIFETHAAVESYEASKHFFGCMMEEGSSVSEHVLKMSGHAKKLSDLGIVIPNQLVALAGVHIRAGLLTISGERVVSGLVQRLGSLDFVNDNVGCFANGGKFPKNGSIIEFGSSASTTAPSPSAVPLAVWWLRTRQDPGSQRHAAGSVEVLVVGTAGAARKQRRKARDKQGLRARPSHRPSATRRLRVHPQRHRRLLSKQP
ncbi:hypothetical protein QYE76_026395 [Lolium multiflorum]|uniref:Zinc finger, CCHC-type n=1 Tax=Lolium multiflorum TaxID=4521 RepID=A0AAD8RKB9_LOLMU|nr:hypothetical protein QYE76_026395 [Lolium multiflorum]